MIRIRYKPDCRRYSCMGDGLPYGFGDIELGVALVLSRAATAYDNERNWGFGL